MDPVGIAAVAAGVVGVVGFFVIRNNERWVANLLAQAKTDASADLAALETRLTAAIAAIKTDLGIHAATPATAPPAPTVLVLHAPSPAATAAPAAPAAPAVAPGKVPLTAAQAAYLAANPSLSITQNPIDPIDPMATTPSHPTGFPVGTVLLSSGLPLTPDGAPDGSALDQSSVVKAS